MKVSELFALLEGLYPLNLQESFDNSGPQLNFCDETVTGILVAVDADVYTMAEAAENSCNVIITHHPLIFTPINNVSCSDPKGRLIADLICRRVSVISLHTNLDKLYPLQLGKILGFGGLNVFETDGNQYGYGFGAEGFLTEEVTLSQLLSRVKAALELEYILYSGESSRRIRKAVIINGSGSSSLKKAAESGADCLITADVKFHSAKDAEMYGICLMDVGHYDSEKMFKKIIKNDLHERAKLNECNVILSSSEKNPLKVYLEK